MALKTWLDDQDMKDFYAEYGELVRKQCVLLMGETKAAEELEERVFSSVREKYENRQLPKDCETMLIARCCILSSRMEFPDGGEEIQAEPETRAVPAGKARAAVCEPENIPDEIRSIRVTATYDPEKTELWMPDGLHPDSVRLQSDPEDPEEMAADRSVAHSIVNTFLVLFFIGSVGFFAWKTGVLRQLGNILEGLFMYG